MPSDPGGANGNKIVTQSEGEACFATYLEQRQLDYQYEVPVGTRCPDFLVAHPLGTVACEVFEPVIRLPNQVGAFTSYPALRGGFEARKGKQAKAAKEAGIPFVAVFAGTNSDIAIDPLLLMGAMFGDISVQFTVSVEPDVPPDPRTVFGGGGRVQPLRNRGVSAAAILTRFNPTLWKVEAAYRERLPPRESVQEEDDKVQYIETIISTFQEFTDAGQYDECARLSRLTVLHNPYAEHPLSLDVFGGPYDRQWARMDESGRSLYIEVAQGIGCFELPGQD